jgi:hypothetical protein
MAIERQKDVVGANCRQRDGARSYAYAENLAAASVCPIRCRTQLITYDRPLPTVYFCFKNVTIDCSLILLRVQVTIEAISRFASIWHRLRLLSMPVRASGRRSEKDNLQESERHGNLQTPVRTLSLKKEARMKRERCSMKAENMSCAAQAPGDRSTTTTIQRNRDSQLWKDMHLFTPSAYIDFCFRRVACICVNEQLSLANFGIEMHPGAVHACVKGKTTCNIFKISQSACTSMFPSNLLCFCNMKRSRRDLRGSPLVSAIALGCRPRFSTVPLPLLSSLYCTPRCDSARPCSRLYQNCITCSPLTWSSSLILKRFFVC